MIEECEKALQEFEGDIVEIGAGYGENTVKFIELANKYSRLVHVIDPFEGGWGDMPETYRYAKSIFDSTIENQSIINRYAVKVHEINSLSHEAFLLCKTELTIAFAYVDGLQFFGAVISDIETVSKAGVICLDDYDRQTAESQVPQAVKYFMTRNPEKKLTIRDRWAFIR